LILAEAVNEHLGVQPFVVTSSTDMGIRNLCSPPESVGADRLLNASAAHARFQSACIVVDFGTATTFNAVTESGDFLGGAIAPGLRTAADALTAAAPRLAGLDLAAPESPIGTSTITALRSGIVLGHAVMVDGLVGKMLAEIGHPAVVMATGGLAGIVAPLTNSIQHIDKDLTLHGIRLAYERAHLVIE
jgi:type III pantothenate kinase